MVALPNDPLFADQWALDKIGAVEAWGVITGSAELVIAIIDSGIDTSHPDLIGRLWVNPGEIADNGVDDDNNGYIDDINGWNIWSTSAFSAISTARPFGKVVISGLTKGTQRQ